MPFGFGAAGAAWVFTRSGGAWTQQGNKLIGCGAVGKSAPSVVLSADDSIVMVGGSNDKWGIGAARVFTRGGGSDYP